MIVTKNWFLGEPNDLHKISMEFAVPMEFPIQLAVASHIVLVFASFCSK